jgi:hypothetical protein
MAEHAWWAEREAAKIAQLVEGLHPHEALNEKVNDLVIADARLSELLKDLEELDEIGASRLSKTWVAISKSNEVAMIRDRVAQFRAWFAKQNPQQPLGREGLSTLHELVALFRKTIALFHSNAELILRAVQSVPTEDLLPLNVELARVFGRYQPRVT